jgi:hypothetical protein
MKLSKSQPEQKLVKMYWLTFGKLSFLELTISNSIFFYSSFLGAVRMQQSKMIPVIYLNFAMRKRNAKANNVFFANKIADI